MYEISFILKEEEVSPVRKVFSNRGVEIQVAGELRKIRLAYPVKKNEYGFLGSFKFEAGSEDLENIFNDLKPEGGVLRYMVAKLEKKETEVREKGRVFQPQPVYRKQEELKRHLEPVLTNEELEKKIEEILQ